MPSPRIVLALIVATAVVLFCMAAALLVTMVHRRRVLRQPRQLPARSSPLPSAAQAAAPAEQAATASSRSWLNRKAPMPPAECSSVFASDGSDRGRASLHALRDDVDQQRRRAGKQPLRGPPQWPQASPRFDLWERELARFDMPPLILADRLPVEVPLEEIVLSTERDIFERVRAEQQLGRGPPSLRAVALPSSPRRGSRAAATMPRAGGGGVAAACGCSQRGGAAGAGGAGGGSANGEARRLHGASEAGSSGQPAGTRTAQRHARAASAPRPTPLRLEATARTARTAPRPPRGRWMAAAAQPERAGRRDRRNHGRGESDARAEPPRTEHSQPPRDAWARRRRPRRRGRAAAPVRHRRAGHGGREPSSRGPYNGPAPAAAAAASCPGSDRLRGASGGASAVRREAGCEQKQLRSW